MSEQREFHFVGGRRKYNAMRRRARATRRHEVAALLAAGMKQSEISLQLQVHKSVISRDARAIVSLLHGERCPYCKRWFRNLWGQASPQCNAEGRPMKRKRPGWLFAF